MHIAIEKLNEAALTSLKGNLRLSPKAVRKGALDVLGSNQGAEADSKTSALCCFTFKLIAPLFGP
jgi:hypothetical protein